MKIAIFHNFLDNIGGAEIVALTLTRELNADLYTTNIDREKISLMGFADILPHIRSIGRLPRQAPFRQQLALGRFRYLNLSGRYDFFIIAGDWAMSGAVNNHPNLWYVHSPLNELWAFKNFIKQEVLSPWKRPLYEAWVAVNRYLARSYARYVDHWACNSRNTQKRVAKFYGIEAQVIHPPINTGAVNNNLATKNPTAKIDNQDDYWLSVNRLITHKRIDLQLSALAELPAEKLIIVGSYEKGAAQFEKYRKYLETLKPSNVEIRHWASSQELQALYAGCRGFITTAQDEDFGMTPLEAMAHGKPVIAPREGGYPESIIDGETGILIDHINSAKLKEAIIKIKDELAVQPGRYQEPCRQQAAAFDVDIFVKKIKKIIYEK